MIFIPVDSDLDIDFSTSTAQTKPPRNGYYAAIISEDHKILIIRKRWSNGLRELYHDLFNKLEPAKYGYGLFENERKLLQKLKSEKDISVLNATPWSKHKAYLPNQIDEVTKLMSATKLSDPVESVTVSKYARTMEDNELFARLELFVTNVNNKAFRTYALPGGQPSEGLTPIENLERELEEELPETVLSLCSHQEKLIPFDSEKKDLSQPNFITEINHLYPYHYKRKIQEDAMASGTPEVEAIVWIPLADLRSWARENHKKNGTICKYYFQDYRDGSYQKLYEWLLSIRGTRVERRDDRREYPRRDQRYNYSGRGYGGPYKSDNNEGNNNRRDNQGRRPFNDKDQKQRF